MYYLFKEVIMKKKLNQKSLQKVWSLLFCFLALLSVTQAKAESNTIRVIQQGKKYTSADGVYYALFKEVSSEELFVYVVCSSDNYYDSYTDITIAESLKLSDFGLSGDTQIPVVGILGEEDRLLDGTKSYDAPIKAHSFDAMSPSDKIGAFSSKRGNEYSGLFRLQTIRIPKCIKYIGSSAFRGCNRLRGIEFYGEGDYCLEYIGDYAFYNVDLSNFDTPSGKFVIPKTIKYIGAHAFHADGVNRNRIPFDFQMVKSEITSIGEYAFYGCAGITRVAFPSTLERIGNYAFRECQNLTDVVIRSNFTANLGPFGCQYNDVQRMLHVQRNIFNEVYGNLPSWVRNYFEWVVELNHGHNWSYKAEDNTIIATCADFDGDCELPDLTATCKFADYSGYDAVASTINGPGFIKSTGFPLTPQIKYYKENGEAIGGLQRKVGRYYAIAQVEDDESTQIRVDFNATMSLSGNGDASNPYQINDVSELQKFVKYVNYGNNSTCGKLLSDIDASSLGNNVMMGSQQNPYCGIFDGNMHTISLKIQKDYLRYGALFSYLGAGTIKNLQTEGEIKSFYGKYSAGIASCIVGAARIEKCISRVVINNPRKVQDEIIDASDGGLVATVEIPENGNLVISNSAFIGTINSQEGNGGLIAYAKSDVTLENCYFNGDMNHPDIWGSDFKTGDNILRKTDGVTITTINCYYKSVSDVSNCLGGQAGMTIVSATQFASGEVCFKLNGSKSDNVIWTQTIGTDNTPVFGKDIVYQHVKGDVALYDNSMLYGAGTLDSPYEITNVYEMQEFRKVVNNGQADACGTLFCDIDASSLNDGVMIGTQANPYCGTFNGNGYTINININRGADNAALFEWLGAGTIKNLQVSGSINNHKHKYCAGIASRVVGAAKVDGCISSVNIVNDENEYTDSQHLGPVNPDSAGDSNLYAFNTDHDDGGIFATVDNKDQEGVIVSNSAFFGNIKSTMGSGWIGYTVSDVTFENCYFNGTMNLGYTNLTWKEYDLRTWFNVWDTHYIEDYTTSDILVRKQDGVTITTTNCYYQNPYKDKNIQNCLNGNEGLTEADGAQFASGDICYKLNGSKSDDVVWTQSLGTDNNPTFGTDVIYQGYVGENKFYVNEDGTLESLTIGDGQAFNSPVDFTATSLTFNRSFATDKGKYTLMVPFDIDNPADYGTFYTFSSYDANNGKVSFATSNTVEANTPYVMAPAKNFTSIELSNAKIHATSATEEQEDELGLIGTYEKITAPEGAYGYAASAADDISQGQFVRLGSNVSVSPYRAYLWLGASAVNAKLDADFSNNGGEITGINSLGNENVGTMYNLNGQVVGKYYNGVVIKNGKKFLNK